MYSSTHISKEMFFSIIQKRLFRYIEAIFGTRGGAVNVASAMHYSIEKMKSIASQDNYFGKSFWGYGINSICDGKEMHSNHDVEVIRAINELNKHHESYRNLLVLVFNVENGFLFVSIFSIDSCTGSVNSNVNTKYDLKDFDNARIVTRNGKLIVEFVFKNLEKAVSFQVDDYNFPQNLSGGQVAKYYIDSIKKLAAEVPKENGLKVKEKVFDFVTDFIDGIKLLQSQDINADCIRKLKEENKKDESSFRYWFQMCLTMKGYCAEPEPQKGNGRIDLKVMHSTISNKIIEFKGWWNNDKKEIINQLYGYLTEFEGEGYIFMINNTKENIVEKYKELIIPSEMKYIDNTWEEILVEPTEYSYFKSKHNFTRIKTVYHFIFSVY